MAHQKPAWFEREQPRDWGKGRIEVEGDRLTLPKVVRVGVAMLLAWGIVALFFCISSK